jgi:hypothetical protein
VKRTEIRPGAKALARGSTFAAPRRSLDRRESKPKRKPAARPRERQPAWWTKEIRGLPCACGQLPEHPAVHGHHIIPVQTLEVKGAPLWDRRNRMPVAFDCHMDHHAAARRLPLARDHPVWEFAGEHGLTWYLERIYR